MKSHQSGFTIVELISVIAASGIFISLVLYFGLSYWRYSSLLESDLDTLVSRLTAQDVIRELIGTSNGLINQNSIPDINADVPDPVAGTSYWEEIHAVPGMITPNTDVQPIIYFRRYSVNSTNDIILNGTQPYQDEYVMYLDGPAKKLMLRTLANTAAPSNKAKTSCPPALASSACPADKVLLDYVSSITVTYYSRSGNTIDYHSSTDPVSGAYTGPDLPVVEALQYNIAISKKPIFQKTNATQNNTVIRIALRNT